jgi:UDP-N-acetylmuramyl pentapeptide synthase
MSKTQILYRKFVAIFFHKFVKQYQKKFSKKIPIILITGTVGKSSQTLILNQIFEKSGYKVWSGTNTNKGLNSLTGIVLTLLNKHINLENESGIRKFTAKINFVFELVKGILFKKWNFTSKEIFIYEIGYDHQEESKTFKNIFPYIDTLIVSNLTYEHSAGFSNEFDSSTYQQYKKYLPIHIQEAFENPEIDALQKNTALEQFTLADKCESLITPINIGNINDSFLILQKGAIKETRVDVQSERGDLDELIASADYFGIKKKYTFSTNYLLPFTFAKSAFISLYISNRFNLSEEILVSSLKNLELPNGRFSKIRGINSTTIIDSTYNSDPSSLDGFFEQIKEKIRYFESTENLEKAQITQSPKHYLILGEMREMGELSIDFHKKAMQEIYNLSSGYKFQVEDVILLGSEWLKIDEDKKVKTTDDHSIIVYNNSMFKVFSKVGDIIEYLKPENIRPNSWLWCKGSQNTIFLESLVEKLLKNPEDEMRLCRRGKEWDEKRKQYL